MFKLDYKFQKSAVAEMLNSTLGQIILPTGTGKSKIQGNYLIERIKANPGFAVYLIVTPRILLTNQLMTDVSVDIAKNGTAFKRITLHSGNEANFEDEGLSVETMSLLTHTDSQSTTSAQTVREEVEKAKAQNIPVLVCATYNSVERIKKALRGYCNVEATLCDESQYIVNDDFFKSIEAVKEISNNTFYFTATQKRTTSNEGRGHNNEAFYGEVLFTRTPKQMIDTGYMLRTRLHFVTSGGTSEQTDEVVIDSYKEHKGTINGDGKMLVVCKGSKELGNITNSKKFQRFARQQGENFKVFDASSEYGFNINSKSIKREKFLNALRTHKGPAIVLHINMLAEGINVPDFTGVLPLCNLAKAKLLQTLGRITRLHVEDRRAFLDNDYLPSDLDEMMKPYAYLIIPTFTDEGEDRKEFLVNLVNELREVNGEAFDPAQDVILKKKDGIFTAEPIDLTTEPTKKEAGNTYNLLFDIHHSLEDERIASMLASDDINDVYNLVTEML